MGGGFDPADGGDGVVVAEIADQVLLALEGVAGWVVEALAVGLGVGTGGGDNRLGVGLDEGGGE